MKTRSINPQSMESSTQDIRKAIQKGITKDVIDAKINSLPNKNQRLELLAVLQGCKELTPAVQEHIKSTFCKMAGVSTKELENIQYNHFMNELEKGVNKKKEVFNG